MSVHLQFISLTKVNSKDYFLGSELNDILHVWARFPIKAILKSQINGELEIVLKFNKRGVKIDGGVGI